MIRDVGSMSRVRRWSRGRSSSALSLLPWSPLGRGTSYLTHVTVSCHLHLVSVATGISIRLAYQTCVKSESLKHVLCMVSIEKGFSFTMIVNLLSYLKN